MKIAFLLTHFPRLSETFILNQITGFIERGHEVDIYAYEPSNEPKMHEDVRKYHLLERTYYYGEAIKNIPVSRIQRILKGFSLLRMHYYNHLWIFLKALNVVKYKWDAASLRILYKIVPFIGRKTYEIIMCHFGPNGDLGVFLNDIGILTGKVVTVFHGYDMSQYIKSNGKGVYNNLFKKGDLFLPISIRWKDELISMGCKEDRILVHHMGIDPERYNSFQRNHKSEDKTIILSIGRLVEKKGIRYGVEAIGRIAKKHQDIEYWIIGDGPLKDEIKAIVEQGNLQKKVKLLGWKSQGEILEYMKNSDILLAPSVTSEDGDQEGIPVVLMEAMAIGLPVVSSYHSGIPELVEDGVSGFLAPERDVEGLAAKLAHCIEHRELWPAITREGRQTVIQNYNIHFLNDRLAMIYQTLIENNSVASMKELTVSNGKKNIHDSPV